MKRAIADARLADGSRVNVDRAAALDRRCDAHHPEIPPDRLTLDKLVKYGTSRRRRPLLEIIGHAGSTPSFRRHRSGKTTLLNCSTNYIDAPSASSPARRRRAAAAAAAMWSRLETRRPHTSKASARSPCATWSELPAYEPGAESIVGGGNAAGGYRLQADEHRP